MSATPFPLARSVAGERQGEGCCRLFVAEAHTSARQSAPGSVNIARCKSDHSDTRRSQIHPASLVVSRLRSDPQNPHATLSRN